jgi:trimeric autotransporter adhesin
MFGSNAGSSSSDASFNLATGRFRVEENAEKPGGGSWVASSDARLKQDIRPYSDGLRSVLAINPVHYRYKEKSARGLQPEYVGVIAQELREVAPYMVGEFERAGETYLNVDNSAMTYMLINAVKELNQKVEAVTPEGMVTRDELEALISEKDAQIEAQQRQIEAILSRLNAFDTDLQQCCFEHSDAIGASGVNQQSANDNPHLEQNIPNPFHENTTIKYYLPNGMRTASIIITDLSGVQLKTFDLGGTRGFGQVLISGGAFPAGTYIYTLTVNGKAVDSKRMVLL